MFFDNQGSLLWSFNAGTVHSVDTTPDGLYVVAGTGPPINGPGAIYFFREGQTNPFPAETGQLMILRQSPFHAGLAVVIVAAPLGILVVRRKRRRTSGTHLSSR